MAETPTTYPGTGVNVDNGGGVAWAAPEKITAYDDDPASVLMQVVNAWSDFLDGKSWGFSIPAGSTIDGILVNVRKATTGPGAEFYHDQHIRLLKAGAPHGDDKAAEDDWNWGGNYKWGVYGGAADLWGGTWTPGDINNALFGLRVSCYRFSGTSGIVAWCDCVLGVVYYTEGPPGGGGSARFQERMIVLGL